MRLVLVQVLRAAAALMVAVHHAGHEAGVIAARTGAPFAESRLLPWAAGVDVFFVISGFIIVHAGRDLYGRPGARARFLAHRVARVVPLYWLVTLAYLAVALRVPALLGEGAQGMLDPAYLAGSFLFWPMARPDGTPQPLYGLGWTLNCEMAFYLLFAVGLGWGRRAAVAWLALALGALVLAAALLPGAGLPLTFWGNPVLLEFVLGAALGLARAEGLRLGAGARLALAGAGLAGLGLGEPLGLDIWGAGRPLLLGLPAAALVAAAVLGAPRPEAGPARASPGLRLAVLLGDASYALYLTHPFVLRAAREALLGTGLAALAGPWGSLALMVGLTLPVALLVHRGLERPLTGAVRRRLDRAVRAPGAGISERA
ncbi:acyltransferase family protein [Methylobacterium sp. A54F]